MVFARLLVMPFNDFVSFGCAKAGVASGGKCLSRIDSCRRECPVAGQTVMEAPGEEDGLARLIIVRKSSPIEGHYPDSSARTPIFSPKKWPTRGSAADEGVRPTQQPNPHHF